MGTIKRNFRGVEKKQMASTLSIALLLGAIVAVMILVMGFKKMKPKRNADKAVADNGGTAAPIKNERARFLK